MAENKLMLWDRVSTTDPSMTKNVTIGKRSYTSISPQYQLRKATKEFGCYGETWGLKNTTYIIIDMPDESKLLVLNAVFFYPSGEFPISSSSTLGEWKTKEDYKTKKEVRVYSVDSDAYKKIETDVTTKALSKLGFNADVFMGKFEDSKYIALAQKAEELDTTLSMKGLELELSTIESLENLTKFYNENKWINSSEKAIDLFKNRTKQLRDAKK